MADFVNGLAGQIGAGPAVLLIGFTAGATFWCIGAAVILWMAHHGR